MSILDWFRPKPTVTASLADAVREQYTDAYLSSVGSTWVSQTTSLITTPEGVLRAYSPTDVSRAKRVRSQFEIWRAGFQSGVGAPLDFVDAPLSEPCPYCAGGTTRTNSRGATECANCGAPR